MPRFTVRGAETADEPRRRDVRYIAYHGTTAPAEPALLESRDRGVGRRKALPRGYNGPRHLFKPVPRALEA
jgi:hypothetical protein